MVYGLDKMVYALPWLYETAIKRSWGDKMVYALPSLDKTAIGLGKVVYGLPWLDKTAIGLHKTVIGGHFGLLVGRLLMKLEFAFLVLQSPNPEHL